MPIFSDNIRVQGRTGTYLGPNEITGSLLVDATTVQNGEVTMTSPLLKFVTNTGVSFIMDQSISSIDLNSDVGSLNSNWSMAGNNLPSTPAFLENAGTGILDPWNAAAATRSSNFIVYNGNVPLTIFGNTDGTGTLPGSFINSFTFSPLPALQIEGGLQVTNDGRIFNKIEGITYIPGDSSIVLNRPSEVASAPWARWESRDPNSIRGNLTLFGSGINQNTDRGNADQSTAYSNGTSPENGAALHIWGASADSSISGVKFAFENLFGDSSGNIYGKSFVIRAANPYIGFPGFTSRLSLLQYSTKLNELILGNVEGTFGKTRLISGHQVEITSQLQLGQYSAATRVGEILLAGNRIRLAGSSTPGAFSEFYLDNVVMYATASALPVLNRPDFVLAIQSSSGNYPATPTVYRVGITSLGQGGGGGGTLPGGLNYDVQYNDNNTFGGGTDKSQTFQYIYDATTNQQAVNPKVKLIGRLEVGNDILASGLNAVAFGFSNAQAFPTRNVASGDYSMTQGEYAAAAGRSSHAEGYDTDANGNYSHAEGRRSTAFGESSHAEGLSTLSEGEGSHAEGQNTAARGMFSHAEGSYTLAVGIHSHAEGFSSQASGLGAHAEGYNTRATGSYSHTEGENTMTIGIASHAEGWFTTASANHSHAEGYLTWASGSYSHAEGIGTIASASGQHAEGMYNIPSSTAIWVLGDGISTSSRHNLVEGHTGEVRFSGSLLVQPGQGYLPFASQSTVLTYNSNTGQIQLMNTSSLTGGGGISEPQYWLKSGSTLFTSGGFQNVQITGSLRASGSLHTFVGTRTTVSGGFFLQPASVPTVQYSTAQSNPSILAYNTTTGQVQRTSLAGIIAPSPPSWSIQFNRGGNFGGTSSLIYSESLNTIFAAAQLNIGLRNTVGTGTYGVVMGSQSFAQGIGSFAQGLQVTASGDYSYAQGSGSVASGLYSYAQGYLTVADNVMTHAEGRETYAGNDSAHAEGHGTRATGLGSHAEGGYTTASGTFSHTEGTYTLASGPGSHAEGFNATASGQASHAEGIFTQAIAYASHAEGESTQARGDRASHAEGYKTQAVGRYSHAEGEETIAPGRSAHAEGAFTSASGFYSHAEGAGARAQGQGSHAEGSSAVASGAFSHAEGNFTLASGYASHAEGNSTTAFGYASHAEGEQVLAFGYASHGEGYNTRAVGDYSHAEGAFTSASGFYSHAEGSGSIAIGTGSHAEGLLTLASGESSHAEGRFSLASGPRSHAEGSYTTASAESSHAEGSGSIASGPYTHAEGVNTLASNTGSHAEGFSTIASGFYSHAEGFSTIGSGFYSHAEGFNTVASRIYSHAEGVNTLASNSGSHAEGFFATASGLYSHAEGSGSVASNAGAHAEGRQTVAGGRFSHAEGYLTSASDDYTHAEGQQTRAIGDGSHAEGFLTLANAIGAHAEGREVTASGNYSHAEGYQTRTLFEYAHAEGKDTVASGSGAHAEGKGTQALGDASHAEGWDTVASGDSSHAEGRLNLASGLASTVRGRQSTASGDYSQASGYRVEALAPYQQVFGQYNVPSTDTGSLFIIGAGFNGSPKNALVFTTASMTFSSSLYYADGIDNLSGQRFLPRASQSLMFVYNQATGQVQLMHTASLIPTERDPIFTSRSASLATTGSNVFTGTQVITGSLFVATGSIPFASQSTVLTINPTTGRFERMLTSSLIGSGDGYWIQSGSRLFTSGGFLDVQITGSLFLSASNSQIGQLINVPLTRNTVKGPHTVIGGIFVSSSNIDNPALYIYQANNIGRSLEIVGGVGMYISSSAGTHDINGTTRFTPGIIGNDSNRVTFLSGSYEAGMVRRKVTETTTGLIVGSGSNNVIHAKSSYGLAGRTIHFPGSQSADYGLTFTVVVQNAYSDLGRGVTNFACANVPIEDPTTDVFQFSNLIEDVPIGVFKYIYLNMSGSGNAWVCESSRFALQNP